MSKPIKDCDEVKDCDCKDRDCIECDIPALERNNYFCGKLMVERDFWCDQEYHMGKQRRHNKLAHGWGTLCGLKVELHPTEECRDKYVVLNPGVAYDCCGREIIVKEKQLIKLPGGIEGKDYTVEKEAKEKAALKRTEIATKKQDIEALNQGLSLLTEGTQEYTDEQAAIKTAKEDLENLEEQLETIVSLIFVALHYRECYTEPVPSLYSECGCDSKCEPNRIREAFEIKLFTKDELKDIQPAYDIPGDGESCDISEGIIDSCPDCSPKPLRQWVILASIEYYIPGEDVVSDDQIDNFKYRRLVPSTDHLYRMIRCLMEKGVGQKGENGDTGPQGLPGTNGINGTNGKDGINGKDGTDGIGLDKKLPKIVKIAPKLGEKINWDTFMKGVKVYFDRPMENIDENTFVVTLEYPLNGQGIYNISRIMGQIDITDLNEHFAQFTPDQHLKGRYDSILKEYAITCRFVLKGDFIIDKKNNLHLDGNHLIMNIDPGAAGTDLPSGDWVPGGYFESWFYIN